MMKLIVLAPLATFVLIATPALATAPAAKPMAAKTAHATHMKKMTTKKTVTKAH